MFFIVKFYCHLIGRYRGINSKLLLDICRLLKSSHYLGYIQYDLPTLAASLLSKYCPTPWVTIRVYHHTTQILILIQYLHNIFIQSNFPRQNFEGMNIAAHNRFFYESSNFEANHNTFFLAEYPYQSDNIDVHYKEFGSMPLIL